MLRLWPAPKRVAKATEAQEIDEWREYEVTNLFDAGQPSGSALVWQRPVAAARTEPANSGFSFDSFQPRVPIHLDRSQGPSICAHSRVL